MVEAPTVDAVVAVGTRRNVCRLTAEAPVLDARLITRGGEKQDATENTERHFGPQTATSTAEAARMLVKVLNEGKRRKANRRRPGETVETSV
jgi:hypothetical protein